MNLEKDFNAYLANLAVMTFKLHNIHWNIEGFQFKSVHEFTESMYDQTFEYFDEIAEIQKIYGASPDCKLADYLKNATIKELDSQKFTTKEAFEVLKSDVQTLIEQASALRNACDELNWFNSVGLLEDQVAYFSKQLWFINAILG